MKHFEEPILSVQEIEVDDVIATSLGGEDSGCPTKLPDDRG